MEVSEIMGPLEAAGAPLDALLVDDCSGSGTGRADHVGEAAIPNERISERAVFLWTDLAGRREFRFAQLAVLLSSAIFIVGAPFAKVTLAHVAAFTPLYVSALVVCDLITAVLLFGQFQYSRLQELLV